MNENQRAILFETEVEPQTEWFQLHHLITDRGSKYSATIAKVSNQEEAKSILLKLKQDKRYKKATHNSYAMRVTQRNQIIDKKSDDGETGAGMAILRVLHRNTLVNVIVIITRWYGGVKLHGDRFKHIVDATQEVINQQNNQSV